MPETTDTVDIDEQLDRLVDRVQDIVEAVAPKADDEEDTPVIEFLDDLEDIVDELEDIVHTVEMTELVEVIEWNDVPAAFEPDDVLHAAREDSEEAVTLGKLLSLVDLTELWDTIDAGQLWREKQELDDELEDVVGEDDDGVGGDSDVNVMGADVELHEIDSELIESEIQSRVHEATGTFREKLLEARQRFKAIREENAERFQDRRRYRSRNPTAVSTLPSIDGQPIGAARFSTVPKDTRHSAAPNRRRIYGSRFESEGGDDHE